MRLLAVLLVLGAAATCQPDPEPNSPSLESPWIDLGPAPQATAHPAKLGPVRPEPQAADAPRPAPTRRDSPTTEPATPLAPIAHTGAGVPEPRRPTLLLPADAIVAAHGPRTLPFAAWPKPGGPATLTTRFLAPEHVPAARRALSERCTGTKAKVTKVRDGVIRLDRAFPYKFGAACLELELDGYPTARTIVQSTDLAVTLRYDLDAAHALVTSLETGAPVAARLTAVSASGALVWSGAADADGYAKMPGVRHHGPTATAAGPLTLVASSDSDFVATALVPDDGDGYLGAYGGQGIPPVFRPEASITTGRTHFHARERVFVQGLVRGASPTRLRLPADGAVTWSATAYDGEKIVSDATVELVGGAFAAQFDLPAGVAPGPLRLRFSVPDAGELGHTIQVVGPDLPFHASIQGQGTEVELTATSEATAATRIVAHPAVPEARDGWEVGPADLGVYVPARAPRRQPQEVGAERKVRLKPGVPARFDFKVPDGPWDIQIEALVTDKDGRTLALRQKRAHRASPRFGLKAPASVAAGPCPPVTAAVLGASPQPATAQLIGPDGQPTDQCQTPGDHLVRAGPAGQTERWMFVYDEDVPPATPVLQRTSEGVLLGLPTPQIRALLTIERGGIVHATVVTATAPWVRVPLPDPQQWAPSATVTILVPRTKRSPARRLRLPLPLRKDRHSIPVHVAAQASPDGVAGTVTTRAGASVQILCIDAKAAQPTDPTRSFWHAWSEGALSSTAAEPSMLTPSPGTLTPPVRRPSIPAPPHEDHALRTGAALPSHGVHGVASDGTLAFSCPTSGSGTVSVLARAATLDRFGAGRADVEFNAIAPPAAVPEPPPSFGSALSLRVGGTRRVHTDTNGAHSLDVLVGNSALALVEQPVRRLVQSDRDTLAGATRRLVGLAVGKSMLPTLGLPGLETPSDVHNATREAVRAVLDRQNDDGSFADEASSVSATLALHLAGEAGVWVSPRQLEMALRHLHRYHLVVPEEAPNRDQWVWRAWLVRRMSGAKDGEPAYTAAESIAGRSDTLFHLARTGKSEMLAGPSKALSDELNAHGHWGEDDLWASAAWGEFAAATPRPAAAIKVWIGDRGAIDASLRAKKHGFARVRVPLADLSDNPTVSVSAEPYGWVGLSLTVRE